MAPRDAAAPPEAFSAARAGVVLRELLAEGVPHPIGTEANRRIRDRIVERFRLLGYETSIQRRFACHAAGVCGMVENIIARRPGASGAAVLLMAHYDSVGAGPGASDDAMGVAALLETARALRNEKTRNPIQFLVTDGEEAALLGAEAFAADATLMRDVAVVVNVENRGTYGASNMFETSTGNRWLARHLAAALPRPQATSFFYEIYNLLPNDTDVTIFKREGKAAVNFAAIRGVHWYHTPFDDLAHASPRTLQHHGENALAIARQLAGADLDARGSSDATYFDILGFTLLWWPAGWTLWMAVASLLLLVAAARRVPPRQMTWGVLAVFVAIVIAAAAGFGVSWLARLRSGGANWTAWPMPSIAAMWLTGIAAALLAAALFRRRSEPLPMLYGVAIVWHAIGIALAIAIPGTAFLLVVPAIAVTICALARAGETTTAAVGATVAAILLFPLALLLYDALGARLMPIIAVVVALLMTFVAPLFARVRIGVVAAVLAIASAVVALALPTWTEARPQRIPLTYVDDEAAPAPQWITGTLTAPLRAAAEFGPADQSRTPWSRGSAWAAPAPDAQLPRVTATQERTAEGVRIRVRSHRGADRISLAFRGGTLLRVNDTPLPPRPQRFRERASDWQFAVAAAVNELVADIAAQGAVEAYASDLTFGLPAGGEALQRARDASPGFTAQDGDVTVSRVRVK